MAMNKHKSRNMLQTLFRLLEAGEAGLSEGEILEELGCDPRTILRYRADLASQSKFMRFEVEHTEVGKRWKARLLRAPGAFRGGAPDKVQQRERLLSTIRTLYLPFPDEEGEEPRAVSAHADAELQISNGDFIKFLDKLIAEEPMSFRYKGREYTGIPLVVCSSRDGVYFVALLYPYLALYTFRLDLFEKALRLDLAKRAATGPLPDLAAERAHIIQRLKTSKNMFITWTRGNEIKIQFRFRNLDRRVVERLCGGAEPITQPDPADASVYDATVRFSGWLEASKFMKENLGTYSILAPEWAVQEFRKEIEQALDEIAV